MKKIIDDLYNQIKYVDDTKAIENYIKILKLMRNNDNLKNKEIITDPYIFSILKNQKKYIPATLTPLASLGCGPYAQNLIDTLDLDERQEIDLSVLIYRESLRYYSKKSNQHFDDVLKYTKNLIDKNNIKITERILISLISYNSLEDNNIDLNREIIKTINKKHPNNELFDFYHLYIMKNLLKLTDTNDWQKTIDSLDKLIQDGLNINLTTDSHSDWNNHILAQNIRALPDEFYYALIDIGADLQTVYNGRSISNYMREKNPERLAILDRYILEKELKFVNKDNKKRKVIL